MRGFTLAVALANAIQATPQPVAVAPVDVKGELPQHWRMRLADRLVRGLERGKLNVVTLDPSRCSNSECWREVAEEAGAKHVVLAQVSVDERDYAVSIRLVDVTNGKPVASTDEVCEVCGVEETGDLMADQAAALVRRLETMNVEPGRLAIDSAPRGARIWVDGAMAGSTPLELDLSQGKHAIRLALEGHSTQEIQVQTVEGVREHLRLSLAALPKIKSRQVEQAEILRPWGLSSLSVGVASFAAGVALLAVHGTQIRCDRHWRDAQGDCPFEYRSLPAGIAATVLGALLVTTGAVLLGVSRKRLRRLSLGDGVAVHF